jgi:hypothetical protein
MVAAEEPQRPFAAGMYDYYLGGTTNSAADRAAADHVRAVLPEITEVARTNRTFLQRSVARMAREWGIRQFLDIGAGLPTQSNTHEVVREALDPEEKFTVLYVDLDPLVIRHGRALLEGIGEAAVIQGDLRDPDGILVTPEAGRLLDLGRPIGVLMFSVTQFIPDSDDPWALVRRYVDLMAPGSFLALSAPTSDYQSPEARTTIVRVYGSTPTPAASRNLAEVSRFFDGLDIVPPYQGADPAVAIADRWGSPAPTSAGPASGWMYAAVGRKNQ